MRVSRSSWLLIGVLVLLVNLPIVYSSFTRASVVRSGEDVVAPVTETRNLGTEAEPRWWLSYRLPRDIDPDGRSWSAEVDAATYDDAERDDTVAVRVIAGKPASAIVDGEVRRSTYRTGTIIADVVIFAILLLLWRVRFRHRREVETVEALEDVEPGRMHALWQDLGDGTVRVSGEVLEHDEHEVVLDLGERLVRVVLDGHTNPVGRRERAEVRVRPPG
ncbi:hypothetical protein [Nocardioides currus]|uniref:hypothetical protein n=1 Tax=Nocardioides currus TaxID=2133958 RepID=UPI0010574DFD|nr:hypothetical protein [Nocardioides currus]